MPSRVPKTLEGCGRVDDVGHEDGSQNPHTGVFLGCAIRARARELDDVPRHVAENPGVVARWYFVSVAPANFDLAPALDLDVQVPTERGAEMPNLAGSGADLWRDVNGPPPPGLELHPADGRLVEVDDGHPAAT